MSCRSYNVNFVANSRPPYLHHKIFTLLFMSIPATTSNVSGILTAMDSCLTQRRQMLLASLRSTIADAQESDVPNEDNTITSELQQCSTSDRFVYNGDQIN